VWIVTTTFIGTRFFAEPQTVSDLGEGMRTVGFSAAPGLLNALVFMVPAQGDVIRGATLLWMYVAMVVAVRQALDYEGRWSTPKAALVCAIGFVVQIVLTTAAQLVLLS
jgi:hypothetical protein